MIKSSEVIIRECGKRNRDWDASDLASQLTVMGCKTSEGTVRVWFRGEGAPNYERACALVKLFGLSDVAEILPKPRFSKVN